MTPATKKNGELPGFERPTHREIDAVIAPYLALRDEHRTLTARLKEAKQLVHEKLAAYRDELEEDGNGDPCYVYSDGTRAVAVVLQTGVEKLQVRPLDGDAEIIDD
jgi:hypothetical protein